VYDDCKAYFLRIFASADKGEEVAVGEGEEDDEEAAASLAVVPSMIGTQVGGC